MASKRIKEVMKGFEDLSDHEKEALAKLLGTDEQRRRLKITNSDKGATWKPDHDNELVGWALLAEMIGIADLDFVTELANQLVNAGSVGRKGNESAINFMLAVIRDIKPRDSVEAMLAAQITSVHVSAMTLGGRLANAETVAQQDSAERAFNKLLRTFTTQMEALRKYRNGGEQKVTVQHVSVGEGGQAIVGNVTQKGKRRRQRQSAQPQQRRIADAKSKPMPIAEGTSADKDPIRTKPEATANGRR